MVVLLRCSPDRRAVHSAQFAREIQPQFQGIKSELQTTERVILHTLKTNAYSWYSQASLSLLSLPPCPNDLICIWFRKFHQGHHGSGFRVAATLGVCPAFVGSLIISEACSPTRFLWGKDDMSSPGNVRHPSFKPSSFAIAVGILLLRLSGGPVGCLRTIEGIPEVLLIIPVTVIISKLQTSFKNNYFPFPFWFAD